MSGSRAAVAESPESSYKVKRVRIRASSKPTPTAITVTTHFPISRRRFLAIGAAGLSPLALTRSGAESDYTSSQQSATPAPLPADAEARLQARLRLMRVALGRAPA